MSGNPHLYNALVDVEHFSKHGFCVARKVDRVKAVEHLPHHVLAPVVGRVDEHRLDTQGTGTLVYKALFGVACADEEHHCVLEQGLTGGLALSAAGSSQGVGLGTLSNTEGRAGLSNHGSSGCAHVQRAAWPKICSRYRGGGGGGAKRGGVVPMRAHTCLWQGYVGRMGLGGGDTVPRQVATSTACWFVAHKRWGNEARCVYGMQCAIIPR